MPLLFPAPVRITFRARFSAMRHYLTSTLCSSVLGVAAWAGEPNAGRPWETSAYDLEMGVLWGIGTGTTFDYRLVPVQFSWRSREFMGQAFSDGSRIVVRHRLTLIGTWMHNGPETHYIGVAGSPSVEWWDRTGRWSLFTGAGGGFGVTNSKASEGGLGQDLTLNWFIRGGVEHVIARNRRLSAGIMYQHMSNGGMSDPNPGIDALGFTVGYGWSY
jgi:hypothetical protein